MPKYRQHDCSPAYLDGVSVASEQLANKGIGYPKTPSQMNPQERRAFWTGYHETLREVNFR